MPNHWHAPPHTGNSAKSLAQAILPNHWHAPPHCRLLDQITGTLSTDRQICQITGMLLHIQAILPNHWHRKFCQITGMLLHIVGYWTKSLAHCPQTDNSAKSLACSSTYRQFCQITGTLSTDRQFCQITGTGNYAKSLARSSTYRQFCQITGTGNSAKSLACSSTL
jgi:hypothetical protein